MIIAIDIDCTLNDLAWQWMFWLNKKYNLDLSYYQLKSYNMTDNYPMLSKIQVYEPFEHKDFLDSIHPTEDAQQCLRYLNSVYDVYLVSSTYIKNVAQKVEWVHQHYPFIADNQLVFTQNKKLVRCDWLVDDCPDNLLRFDCKTIQYLQPWNADKLYGQMKAVDWKSIVYMIENGKDFNE